MNGERQLEEELLEKRSKVKQLQEKLQLNNKKIKLLRKENQEYKLAANRRNQADTALLLHSKELSDGNAKLEATIEELTTQLEQPSTQPMPEIVNIKEQTYTSTSVEVDLPGQELTDEDILPLEGFSQVEDFILGENQLKGEGVVMICAHFPKLKKLILNKNMFKAESLQNIGKCQELKYLDIRDNNLGDQCCEYVGSCPNLQELSLSKNSISDQGFLHLGALQNLTYLDITNNKLTDQSQPALIKLNKLRHLYLMSNQLTLLSVQQILAAIKELKVLDVRFNKLTTEDKEKARGEKSEDIQLFC